MSNHRARRLPGLQKALTFLSGRRTETDVLSIRSLAVAADVSYVTMWKAVRLHAMSAGRETNAPHQPGAADQPREFVWERLKHRISSDLLQGSLSRGANLPQIKDLCSRYHAGYRAMRKALDALCREELLRRHGLRYCVKGAPRSKSSLALRLLAYVAPFMSRSDPVTFMAEYDQEFVRSLEIECSGSQVGLDRARPVSVSL